MSAAKDGLALRSQMVNPTKANVPGSLKAAALPNREGAQQFPSTQEIW